LSNIFDMARISASEVSHFDVYSCFPAVVEITRDALGMSLTDPRLLTVTGGLPYFGGAGNNYSMHAIAAMMQRLREAPGERGLVTANGWYLTKHALGLYSTARPEHDFAVQQANALNDRIAAMQHPVMDPNPSGPGTVETFTVMFDRSGEPTQGIILGKLQSGRRFVAHTRPDLTLLEQITRDDPIGRSGRVSSTHTTNLFEFK